MAPRRPIEREFGVPVPGLILPQEQWSNCGFKRLPSDGTLHWREVFGRDAPVVVDLGCGNGRFLIASSLLRPDHVHFGVDFLPLVIRYATRRGNQRGLSNLRFAVAEAHELLERWIEPHTVSELHVYHPQPYYDPAKIDRRLVTPAFLVLARRALVPGGQFFIQTDNPGYWRYMMSVVPLFFHFEPREQTWPEAPKGRTRREIIALRRGLPVFRGQGTVRCDLDDAQAVALAEKLPPPTFDADERLRELDRLD